MENLVNINQESVGNKIYTIRGEKVMLDFDLAEIYGYETKAFNRQVKNNIEKFEGEDFMFRLTEDEAANLSRCQNITTIGQDLSWCKNCTSIANSTSRSQNATSIMQTKGIKGGRVYLPYAFTESGIYMLMTVLKGELATKQSRTLIRLFRVLKDNHLYNRDLVSSVVNNSVEIERLKNDVGKINRRLDSTLKKSDISPILLNFSSDVQNEFVFMNGELAKATETYIDIYGKAKKSIKESVREY